ncbi:hypothetical protein Bca52824_023126 [Brassica carinata]|uniref:Ion transport domain-containing protein n=1 Tax=Brassica carinata TaxID=52824 RepID=A0A8X7VHY0_BRACI|nr:hypothetical protein Bca52824_023126 [Brassica carinata]
MVSPNENDKTPMLSISDASSSSSSRTRAFTSRTRSVPLSNPTDQTDNSSAVTLGYAGSLRSQSRRPPLVPMAGPLSSSTRRPEPFFLPPTRRSSGYFGDLEEVNSDDGEFVLEHAHLLRSGKLGMCNDPYCTTCPSNYNHKASRLPNPTVSASTFHNALYDDAISWARRFASCVNICLPGIMNPHSKAVQIWTKFFAVSSLFAIFIDPFFFFVILVQKILLISILLGIPAQLGASRGSYAKDFFRAANLVQYILKLFRLLPLFKLAGQTTTGFIFESTWENFVTNLLTFMLAGHVVGSCWYFFGLRRINQCVLNACGHSERECRDLINCGHVDSKISASLRALWRDNARANACFREDGFTYGIYMNAVNLTHHSSLFTRYSYSLLWGFQQISTLAGNQVPSYFQPRDERLKTIDSTARIE